MSKVFIILDSGIDFILFRIINQVDDVLYASGFIRNLHGSFKSVKLTVIQFHYFGSKKIKLVQIFILTKPCSLHKPRYITVIISYEPFFIMSAVSIGCSWFNSNPFKDLFHFFFCGWKSDPLTYKLTLVIFSEVCNVSFNRTVMLIGKSHHAFTSCSFCQSGRHLFSGIKKAPYPSPLW